MCTYSACAKLQAMIWSINAPIKILPHLPIRAKVGDLTLLRSILLMMGDEYVLSVMGGELFTKM